MKAIKDKIAAPYAVEGVAGAEADGFVTTLVNQYYSTDTKERAKATPAAIVEADQKIAALYAEIQKLYDAEGAANADALKSLNDLSLIHCFSPFSNLNHAAVWPPVV